MSFKQKVIRYINKRIKILEKASTTKPEHIKICPPEAENIVRSSLNFAAMELKFLKNDIKKIKSVEEILDECRQMRGLPEELRHRTFYEFGAFLQDMVNFLVFGEYSKDKDLKEFQEKINREKWNPEDFNTYLKLFYQFWKNIVEKASDKCI